MILIVKSTLLWLKLVFSLKIIEYISFLLEKGFKSKPVKTKTDENKFSEKKPEISDEKKVKKPVNLIKNREFSVKKPEISNEKMVKKPIKSTKSRDVSEKKPEKPEISNEKARKSLNCSPTFSKLFSFISYE